MRIDPPCIADPANPEPPQQPRCPQCGRPKVPDSIGHRHTGALCFWCGFNEDAGRRAPA